MSTHADVNSVKFSNEDIESWATEDESDEGYTGGHPVRRGLADR